MNEGHGKVQVGTAHMLTHVPADMYMHTAWTQTCTNARTYTHMHVHTDDCMHKDTKIRERIHNINTPACTHKYPRVRK